MPPKSHIFWYYAINVWFRTISLCTIHEKSKIHEKLHIFNTQKHYLMQKRFTELFVATDTISLSQQMQSKYSQWTVAVPMVNTPKRFKVVFVNRIIMSLLSQLCNKLKLFQSSHILTKQVIKLNTCTVQNQNMNNREQSKRKLSWTHLLCNDVIFTWQKNLTPHCTGTALPFCRLLSEWKPVQSNFFSKNVKKNERTHI